MVAAYGTTMNFGLLTAVRASNQSSLNGQGVMGVPFQLSVRGCVMCGLCCYGHFPSRSSNRCFVAISTYLHHFSHFHDPFSSTHQITCSHYLVVTPSLPSIYILSSSRFPRVRERKLDETRFRLPWTRSQSHATCQNLYTHFPLKLRT